MVSGDQVVAEQVLEICPQAEAVVIKQALGNQAAECLAPVRAREMIEAGARRCVQRALAGELVPFSGGGPYEFEVELRAPVSDHMCDNLAGFDYFTISDHQSVYVVAPDMDLGFRRVAYLGYADAPGVTRH